ncbi:hypothetical protein [Extibacter muris]|uniref:hypothetical protein n=1 Tax=Extibacter muris TaxID=1796622 RepID=UPI001D0733B5|nr:hypothetical protein [Extibacter muris]MCB6202680.1 hypothetical protein [Extibacter muris]MCQ4664524.1 hypothetical protein [Extibacter muris]MCQ4693733.1 hypothetical protein [Extibacter muris]
MLRKLLQSILGDNFTENNEKYAKINFCIIILMFFVSAVMLFFLPEKIEILHNGDTYYPIPSVIGVWLPPVIALLVNLSFMKQKRLSAINTGIMTLLFLFSTGYYFTLM